MNAWRCVGTELRAAGRAARYNPDPAEVPPPRAERLATAGVAVGVLIGAIGTYVAIVGGVGPMVAQAPAAGRPASPLTSPVAPTGGGPAPSRTPVVTTTAPAAPPPRSTTAQLPAARPMTVPTTSAPPAATPPPSPTPGLTPSPDPRHSNTPSPG